MWGNREFGGMRPRVAARNLPETAAQLARNCWLDRGRPRAVPQPARVGGVAQFDVNVRSIFRFDAGGPGGADRWFAWDEDVDVVRAPIHQDAVKRTIWTGDGYPRQTSTTIMGGGFVSPGKPVSRRLGLPPPAAAPTAVEGALTDEDDTREREYHSWVFTWLTDLDEEGPPSPATPAVDRGFNADGTIQPVTVTMPTALTGSYGANRKRLYRTATGASGATTWRLVATIAIATATYTDTVLTQDLGDELISADWDPPPDELEGLIGLPNGVLAGFTGRDVYLSEPWQPHAWPGDYVQTLPFDIVGLSNFGTNIVVGTTGQPVLLSGAHPATMFPSRMELSQPAVAKRSFAYVDQQGVVFASPEGLVLVGPAGGRILSEEHYAKEQWETLSPRQFRAVYHDGAYLAFSDTKAYALGPAMGGAVEFDDAGVKAVHHDTERDAVYVVAADRYLKEWKTSASDGDAMRSLKWKSKLHTGAARAYPAAQVIAEAYPVEFRVFAEEAEVLDVQVLNRRPFKLPEEIGQSGRWEYEVGGTHTIEEVRIGAVEEMLGADTDRLVLPGIRRFEWHEGQPVNVQLPAATASSGSPTISYSVTGLPAGLSFDADTRTISGSVASTGTGTLMYKATATGYERALDIVDWTVGLRTLSLPAIGPYSWRNGLWVSVQLPAATASYGAPAIAYAVTGLPAGLSFSSSTRRITGTPSTTGTGSLTYSATATGYDTVSRRALWSVEEIPSNALTWRGIPLSYRGQILTWR